MPTNANWASDTGTASINKDFISVKNFDIHTIPVA
jgi:hypothetical protein